jgi:phage terminase small subunit
MMTEMQRRFALEYLNDPRRNAAQAAIRAGYARKNAKTTAHWLLKDPEIVDFIDRQLTKHLRKLQVDEAMVIKGLLQTIEKANDAGQGAWQSQTVTRCYELLGKYLGLFTDKVEVGSDQQIMDAIVLGRKYALKRQREEQPREELAEEFDDAEKKPN